MERISHYEIVRRLGQGGMGEVFEATDLDLGRRVALKFVVDRLAHQPNDLKRFEREARVAGSLHHPHIATLFSFDRSTERPFIVMELLAGRTLREVVMLGPMPVAEALGIARDVAGALAYAHRQRVVHRDIKPENLMFDAEGTIKVTDFGLAKIAEVSRITTTGATLGTASYMSPESVRAAQNFETEEVFGDGAPADVFALGVTLYEMLTGSLPFRGSNALATLYAIANDPPRPLRDLRPEIAGEVDALVDRLLLKDPSRRPTAAEVAIELATLTGVAPSPAWSVASERARLPDSLATSG
ncbi:MAG: serine/threonine protein kinase, partial [Candidatus Eisenbacteria bacterium]|nr:serine/threonine protein kinase [Candidatus Eisenbacteria bacterium]